ncbi:hypothetical protein [uncultured Dokdonia sp.]|uniref:hypothetical protein n=1 Tax=uncultured Dokdonia sp. TaxID=575653 RepID=UPI002620F7EA|nr:hypothetical protein [uncultured Dokdonia sp.]
MKYESERYAVVNKPTPELALYFDKVYCLDGSTKSVFPTGNHLYLPEISRDIPEFIIDTQNSLNIDNWDFKKIITKKSAHLLNENFNGEITINIKKLSQRIKKGKLHFMGDMRDILQFKPTFDKKNFDFDFFFKNLLIASTTNFHRESGKYVVPVFQDHNSYNWLKGADLNQGIELALLDLPIIEGKNLKWNHVKEVREDKESIKQLRNLRLFLDGIEVNKGKSYIQDFLLQKIENYEDASKKHGFEIKKEPVKAIIDLVHIPKLVACGILSLIDPSLTTLAGVLSLTELGGAVNEIGSLALEFKGRKVMKGLDSKYQDVEYLIKIKEQLKK